MRFAPAKGQHPFQLHNPLDVDDDEPLRAGMSGDRGRIPVDARAAGNLHQPACFEVDEQEPYPGIENKIADRVEVIVARVVGNDDARVAQHLDEAGCPAAMRRVHAVPGPRFVRIRVAARDEQRVGGGYPGLRVGVEL